uniref:lysozyme n=1 Tax=Timema cristinae TaxID=61476 RepID=A0A7R9CMJ6_TIMCR|nr:unnamed protein product [Timema cristinae]
MVSASYRIKRVTTVTSIVLAAMLLAHPGHCKVFTRCGLVQELVRQQFPEALLANWVCLINDRFWCTHGRPGGGCNVSCEELISDDITTSSTCAKKIYKRRGFWSWYGWVNKCHGHQLPDIRHCQPPPHNISQYDVVRV